jgi:hypothetical protein
MRSHGGGTCCINHGHIAILQRWFNAAASTVNRRMTSGILCLRTKKYRLKGIDIVSFSRLLQEAPSLSIAALVIVAPDYCPSINTVSTAKEPH